MPWIWTLTCKGSHALDLRQSILKLGCGSLVSVRRELYLQMADSSTLEQQQFWHRMLITVWVFADECDTCIQSILLLLLLPKVMDQLEKLKCSKSLGLR